MSRANGYVQTYTQGQWARLSVQSALVLLLACGRGADDRDARALAAADPATASSTIKGLATSCPGIKRSLDLLTRASIRGRLLIGLVDDALARAREVCPDIAASIAGTGPAHELARARIADANPADALAQLETVREPGIRLRRAELLDRLGRTDDAITELDAIARDEEAATTRRLYAIAVAARANRITELASMIASAPLTERPSLAFRAAAETALDSLDALALAGPELASAAADRLEQERGPARALDARLRAVDGAPDLAENWDALGRAQIAAGNINDALTAWDRAAANAPAQRAYRTTPIRALVLANRTDLARERATALAKHARERGDIESLQTASAGAAAATLTALALELAREAHAQRPRDGQLAFLVAQRHAEAGDHAAAADRYVELLVCGAHGRPWHRHEVSAKLVEHVDPPTIRAALAKPHTCEVADPPDLERYLAAIQTQLQR